MERYWAAERSVARERLAQEAAAAAAEGATPALAARLSEGAAALDAARGRVAALRAACLQGEGHVLRLLDAALGGGGGGGGVQHG